MSEANRLGTLAGLAMAAVLAACATGTSSIGGTSNHTDGGAGTGNGGGAGQGGASGSGGSGEGGSAGDAGGGTGGAAGSAGGGTGGAAGAGGSAGGGTGGAAGAGGSAGGGTGGAAGAGGTCTTPIQQPCDLVPQCGCGATQNCDVTAADGSTACVAAGTVAAWNTCSNLGDCTKGTSCVSSVCKPFCASVADCPGAHRECIAVSADVGGTPTPIPGFKVCTAQCDPVDPSAVCGPGVGCYFVAQGSSDTDCVGGVGTGVGAGACSSANPLSCAPGYICLTTGACVKWCRVGFPGDCPGGQSCGSFTTPSTIDGVEYGACQ